jgi:hypothetical protein
VKDLAGEPVLLSERESKRPRIYYPAPSLCFDSMNCISWLEQSELLVELWREQTGEAFMYKDPF